MVKLHDAVIEVSVVGGTSNFSRVGRLMDDNLRPVLAVAVLVDVGRAVKEKVTVGNFARADISDCSSTTISAAGARITAKGLVAAAGQCVGGCSNAVEDAGDMVSGALIGPLEIFIQSVSRALTSVVGSGGGLGVCDGVSALERFANQKLVSVASVNGFTQHIVYLQSAALAATVRASSLRQMVERQGVLYFSSLRTVHV